MPELHSEKDVSLDDFLTRFSQEILNRSVYSLYGVDVLQVLYEEKDVIADLTEERLEAVLSYLERKLDLPWMESIKEVIAQSEILN